MQGFIWKGQGLLRGDRSLKECLWWSPTSSVDGLPLASGFFHQARKICDKGLC